MYNKRFALLVLGLLAAGPQIAAGQTIVGDLNNFDTINDTGQTCYGFEIEIHNVRSTDITYTYDWNHYGAPKIGEDLSDPAVPKVFVRYESTKDSGGAWGANGSFTSPAIPTIAPPAGHSCTNPGVNEGCEHFGVGYYGTPTVVKYRWLVDGGGGALVYFGSPVALARPTWNYAPPAGGVQAQVVAAIPAPAAPVAGRKFGEPTWVKVIKTTSHKAKPVALADLVSDDKDNDGKPDWTNGEPDEVETEWFLLQTNPDGGAKEEIVGQADDMGDGSEVVTRRYEFYKYGAAPDTLDGETGEAMCSEVQPITDPSSGLYLHGIGTSVAVTDPDGNTYYVDCEAQVVVGNYIGAQMAGFDVAPPLGIIDHLQDGESGTAYVARTVVIAGQPPYSVTVSHGSLPPGLAIDEPSGVMSGTPTSGGDFPFTLEATDQTGTTVSQTYSLHITGVAAPQFDLGVAKLGSGAGTVSGNGLSCDPTCSVHLDSGTSVALTATASSGSVFSGWSGPCTGTGSCSFTLSTATTVFATFTKQWQLTVSKAGTGTGTVSGSGIDCGGTCSAVLDEGTTAALVATPTGGSIFTGWGGACTGLAGCSTLMSQDRTVTGTFVPPTQTFTLSVSVTGSGSVTSVPKGINCGRTCSKAYTVGTTVTLTAKPAKKHAFLGWTGACLASGTSLTCTIPMMKAESAGAVFN